MSRQQRFKNFVFSDKVKYQSQIVSEPRNQIEVCKQLFLFFLQGKKFGNNE
jgi:hypothetical protein